MSISETSVIILEMGEEDPQSVYEDKNIIFDAAFANRHDTSHDQRNVATKVQHLSEDFAGGSHSLSQGGSPKSLFPPPLLSTPQNSGGESARTNHCYKKLFLQHGEDLLNARPVFDGYGQTAGKGATDMNVPSDSCFFELHAADGTEISSCGHAASQQSLREIPGGYEKDIAAKEGRRSTEFMETAPCKQPLSLSAVKRMLTSSATSAARVPFVEEYNDLLGDYNKKLEEAAVSYAHYAEELKKHFKPSPVVIPSHLINNFSDTNVIEAKEHRGRLDIVTSLVTPHKEQSRTEKGVMPLVTATEPRPEEGDESQQERRPFVLPSLETDALMEKQQHHHFQQRQEECGPRFTLQSLPNGDLRERDKFSGQDYWDCEAPVVQRRLFPSRLLDESERERFYNYRMYSRRWGALLRELATAIGGEEGAELLSRYEAREESLPLPYSCRRDFYESVVDYDELLGKQKQLMERVERDLEEFYAKTRGEPKE